MATLDADWRGERLYQSSFHEVAISKQKAFPKGSLRRGQTKSFGVVPTPFGAVELTAHKNDFADLDIEHNIYGGKLLRNDGEVCGRCFFSTYRNVRGSGWLTVADIDYCMDKISQPATDYFQILLANDGTDVEDAFNDEGLLTADEIWIAPELRGTQAWKVLYFCTMSAVFVHQRRMYEHFVFRADPLPMPGEEISDIELQQQSRQLQRFYAVHLGARILRVDGELTPFMRAPVPDAFFGLEQDLKG